LPNYSYINNKLNSITKKKSAIELLTESHKNKTIKELKKLTSMQKYILNEYYVKRGNKINKFSKDFNHLDTLIELCHKLILYDSTCDHSTIKDIDIDDKAFTINDDAKNYIYKYPKLLRR